MLKFSQTVHLFHVFHTIFRGVRPGGYGKILVSELSLFSETESSTDNRISGNPDKSDQ